MNGYLIHFTVYSFAMAGFIMIALLIYKKAVYNCGNNKDKRFLDIENTLKLGPCKTLYVIKAGSEKFLIAGDSSSTTMLSKLEKDDDIDCEYYNHSSKIQNISSLKRLTKK